jgi:hypothetical protein
MSTVVCSGLTFEVSPVDKADGVFIVPVGSSYRWSTPSVSNASLVGGQSDTNRPYITGKLTNFTNVQQSAVYSVIPTAPAPGSCEGASFTLVVYVNPKAVITPMSTTVCSGVQFNVTPVNGTNGIVPQGTKYTWLSPSVSTASLTGGDSMNSLQDGIYGKLRNGTNTMRTAVYTVTPTSVDCAANTPFTLTVYVNPTPEITAMTTVICSGASFTVTPTNSTNGIVPAGTTYTWSAPSYTSSISGGQPSGISRTSVFGT